jgi:rhodanese-related sulfurtransferase
LPPAHIESLQACFKYQGVNAGEVVVRQGEPGDYYFVIEHGRAQVVREVSGARIELAQIQAGDAFGEEALIAGTNRNATVTMLTDGDLLRLDGADFSRLLREPLLQSVDAEEATRRVGAGSLWLDVRFPAEYRQDGLPGAINIPLNELRDSLANLPKDQEYIVYCQTGRRSSAATFLMSQRGLRACLLEGGLKAMIKMDGVAT